jgi:NAD(P)-dependent dehydrogenase (short-subunit alcohol dehydrogenase family)
MSSSSELKRRRRALVTGSARNLGAAIASRLAEEGYEVLVNGRTESSVAEAVEDLRRRGHRALPCVADVADPASLREALARLPQHDSPVDVLVNNAVSRSFGNALEVTDEGWSSTVDITLTGALNCVRAVLPGMREQGWGRIVNIAGLTGQAGAKDRIAVVTAKGGLIAMTKALAHDEAPYGITVNAISPGPLRTERGDAAKHYHHDLSAIPVGRLGEPDEVADCVAYVAGERAGFVTGQVIAVNGGAYI